VVILFVIFEGKNFQISLSIFMVVFGMLVVFSSLKARETFDVPLISQKGKHFIGGILLIGGFTVGAACLLVK
jgi:hypothetical protein